ncbi:phosphatidate cytidylyltransferase CdsA [Afipia carboxidovorans OM5]|uniref:Phosphatidate cytidylyltransferase n=2 Tax=Afipia carboxidovorans TaxID=40137 RepID=F8BWK2_AFIC5|nr:phosphatidate cytidylyltransferase CdsA [Afipia carboxidovorans OM4]AEI06770.1 phosphatidate cytidylyltransferase CdsA [Afipia carboxidovorans OM5]
MFVFAGGWLWVLLVSVIAIGLFYEWHEIVDPARNPRTFAAGVIALELIGLSLWFGWDGIAWAAAVLGVTLVAFMATTERAWLTVGFVYAAAALAASALIRLDGAMGFQALMFTLLVVWASDIGGYFAGRAIGGPKLWPRVSPNKTWAGSGGAVVLSLVVALAVAWLGWGRLVPVLILAVAVSIVAQLGDLFESALKRRFGVKDSSQIIPGHGGLLDRLDGFVAAIVFVALIGYLRAGADGIGRGFMIW